MILLAMRPNGVLLLPGMFLPESIAQIRFLAFEVHNRYRELLPNRVPRNSPTATPQTDAPPPRHPPQQPHPKQTPPPARHPPQRHHYQTRGPFTAPHNSHLSHHNKRGWLMDKRHQGLRWA